MERIAGWAGLIGLGALCGVWGFGSFSGALVAGLLAVVAAGALSEWLRPAPSALWAGGLVALAAVRLPVWMVFLPALAFESGVGLWSLHSGGNKSGSDLLKRLLGLVCALAWVLPAGVDIAQYTGLWREFAVLSLLISALCLLAGTLSARVSLAESRLLRQMDLQRYTIRSLRARISDLDEEQAQAARTARLAERTRIAREIHDNVGHQLTRAIMQAQAAQVVAQTKGDLATAQSFADLGQTLGEAMTTIRRSVHDLEDEGTDFASQIQDAAGIDGAARAGLGPAASPAFPAHAAASGLASTAAPEASAGLVSGRLAVELKNDIASAPAPVARCFATIIREALNNTVRHSQARTAWVVLRDLPAFWQLVVQDDGGAQRTASVSAQTAMQAGMRPGTSKLGAGRPGQSGSMGVGQPGEQDAQLWRGMGLADIEARAKALGGTALCGPNQQGWRVFVSLPKEAWNTGE
ncbi:two-component sensor histidine kinase [Bombiscardovia nodaiensis]|uniref:histidine kinase n=1 Tax=Bombiscardovia nodaiensis TaxID=2932181 RepID=A0ABN6SE84_9BIFI|nr:two-component sensor histidine kinase [Bombiscardovia nodaiensis]